MVGDNEIGLKKCKSKHVQIILDEFISISDNVNPNTVRFKYSRSSNQERITNLK